VVNLWEVGGTIIHSVFCGDVEFSVTLSSLMVTRIPPIQEMISNQTWRNTGIFKHHMIVLHEQGLMQ